MALPCWLGLFATLFLAASRGLPGDSYLGSNNHGICSFFCPMGLSPSGPIFFQATLRPAPSPRAKGLPFSPSPDLSVLRRLIAPLVDFPPKSLKACLGILNDCGNFFGYAMLPTFVGSFGYWGSPKPPPFRAADDPAHRHSKY